MQPPCFGKYCSVHSNPVQTWRGKRCSSRGWQYREFGADSQFDSCSSLSCLPLDAVHTLINQSWKESFKGSLDWGFCQSNALILWKENPEPMMRMFSSSKGERAAPKTKCCLGSSDFISEIWMTGMLAQDTSVPVGHRLHDRIPGCDWKHLKCLLF